MEMDRLRDTRLALGFLLHRLEGDVLSSSFIEVYTSFIVVYLH